MTDSNQQVIAIERNMYTAQKLINTRHLMNLTDSNKNK
jgi:hypothetical protein